MKVKISYTMDYHSVPDLVISILEKCKDKFHTFSRVRLDPHNMENLLLEINSIREGMSLIDSQLEDAANMMYGYYEANTQEDIKEENNEEG
jgi:hypothetical protein